MKAEAAAVLQSIGMTVSDAFGMLIVRIAREESLPFTPLVPNEETIEAMKAAQRGDTIKVGKPASRPRFNGRLDRASRLSHPTRPRADLSKTDVDRLILVRMGSRSELGI